jgi:hypothetical protein
MISAKKPSVPTSGEARNETAIIGRDNITAKGKTKFNFRRRFEGFNTESNKSSNSRT